MSLSCGVSSASFFLTVLRRLTVTPGRGLCLASSIFSFLVAWRLGTPFSLAVVLTFPWSRRSFTLARKHNPCSLTPPQRLFRWCLSPLCFQEDVIPFPVLISKLCVVGLPLYIQVSAFLFPGSMYPPSFNLLFLKDNHFFNCSAFLSYFFGEA